jgi:hypothetical protein
MKREQIKWMIDPAVAKRFQTETRANDMLPNHVLEELLKLWLDYILPKSKEK